MKKAMTYIMITLVLLLSACAKDGTNKSPEKEIEEPNETVPADEVESEDEQQMKQLKSQLKKIQRHFTN